MEQLVTVITEDLRTALLLIGAVLVGGIILWEVLQRRRAKRAEQDFLKGPLGASREESERGGAADPLFRAETSTREEPTLTLPEISTRDRLTEPPLIDLDVAMREPSTGQGLPLMHSSVGATRLAEVETDAAASEVVQAPPTSEPPAPAQSSPAQSSAAQPESAQSARELGQEAPRPSPSGPPRLELPNEDRRVIVALRVVARSGERFTGASLRQALQGEGFVHGDMAIFHRVMVDGRILLSAASLTKPGNFDLAIMDSSLFLGINVFAVLPGPLPGRDTVDKLLLAGHTLAQRLKGELQDSSGQPLTETRLAEMRREAAAAAG